MSNQEIEKMIREIVKIVMKMEFQISELEKMRLFLLNMRKKGE